MNLGPGGAQRKLRDGWYISNGQRISQPLVYSADHDKHPGKAKGVVAVLKERGVWPTNRDRFLIKCTGGCPVDGSNCCASRLLSIQPDFVEQKSLVQETIEANGECCNIKWLMIS